MQYTNVQEYINTHLKKYPAFSESKSYQAFISLLSEYWYKQAYDTTPEQLKYFVENQQITRNLYNTILIGLGYPKKLLYNLKINERDVLFNFFTDYYRYVSTPDYVKKLGNKFNDQFNIYELYADYRLNNDNDGKKYDWVMVPEPLFLINNDQSKRTQEILNYNEIYNATPTYFVAKQYLENLRKDKSILYPFKTNLLYLELNTDINVNPINQLVGMTVLHYFKNSSVTIEIDNQFYNLNLYKLYQLWYYTVQYYNLIVSSPNFGTVNTIYYNLDNVSFPYDLDRNSLNFIDIIIERYQNLIDKKDIDDFYDEVFKNNFSKNITTEPFDIEDLRKKLMVIIDSRILQKVEDIINIEPNRKIGILSLLFIYTNAINTLIYESGGETSALLLKYKEHLLNNFPIFVENPKEKATYKLLLEFKPYHTQLILRSRYKLETGKDPLENCLLESDPRFVIHDLTGSSVILSDNYNYSISGETGYFNFTNSNIIETNLSGYNYFLLGNYIYSRDINTNIFPTDKAIKIIKKYEINNKFIFELDDVYAGPTGIFERAYKMILHESLKFIKTNDAYFTFSDVLNANEVHTNEIGINLLGVGDYIYSEMDERDKAVKIIGKNTDDFTYYLESFYTGTSGSWTNCFQWIKE